MTSFLVQGINRKTPERQAPPARQLTAPKSFHQRRAFVEEKLAELLCSSGLDIVALKSRLTKEIFIKEVKWEESLNPDHIVVTFVGGTAHRFSLDDLYPAAMNRWYKMRGFDAARAT
jgi:hypothetical protein